MPPPELADVLTDFAPRAATAVRRVEIRPDPSAATRPTQAREDLIAERIAAARAEAAAETEERLFREREAELSVERDRHAREIEELEARHGAASATLIEIRMTEMESRLTSLATAAAARILAGLLSDDIQKRSIERLAAALGEALADPDAVKVRVTGPQSLFAALAERMGERAQHLHHVEAESLDLIVDIDDRLFETRLSEWSEHLNEVLQ